jgi:hypothetical protein
MLNSNYVAIGNSTKNLILNGGAPVRSKKRYLPHQMFDYDKKRANELINEQAVLKMITKVLCDVWFFTLSLNY